MYCPVTVIKINVNLKQYIWMEFCLSPHNINFVNIATHIPNHTIEAALGIMRECRFSRSNPW